LFASKLVESGVYSVEILCALLEADVLSVDRLVNEMKFPRPMAQAIKKTKFSPISGHIGEDDLDLWLKLSLGDLPSPLMTETLSALDTLGYFTLEMLRGDEELTLNHLMTKGSVNEFIAHTILLNLNRERNIGSLSSSSSFSTFVVDGKDTKTLSSTQSPRERQESGVLPLLSPRSRFTTDSNSILKPILRSNIEIQTPINSGGFSTVYKALWRETSIALKVIRWTPTTPQIPKVEREISILQSLRHPRILILMGVCRDMNPTEGNIGLLFELMEYSLYQYLHDGLAMTKGTSPSDLLNQLRMCLDIADGMKFLHSHDPLILHRDLKSGNILLDVEGRCKICDFGLSTFKDFTSSQTTSLVSTPAWTDPCVLKGQSKFTESSDCYSFGVIVWEILTGEIPWKNLSTLDIIRDVGMLGNRLTIPESIPISLREYLTRCFGEPTNRPTFVMSYEIFSQLQRVVSNTTNSRGRPTLEEYRSVLEEVMEDVVMVLQNR